MIDPRTGATVYSRFAILPAEGERPTKPPLRPLKCVWDGERSVDYVFRLCRRVLDRLGLCGEYFSGPAGRGDLTGREAWKSLWTHQGRNYRWVACFAVTGANEGHYVHVELIGWDGHGRLAKEARLPLFLGKTFQGYESAARAAMVLGALFGA